MPRGIWEIVDAAVKECAPRVEDEVNSDFGLLVTFDKEVSGRDKCTNTEGNAKATAPQQSIPQTNNELSHRYSPQFDLVANPAS